MSKKEHEFTQFLRAEYDERKSRNSSYSIRAFSKFLGVNSSVVSNLFSGKTTPSVKYIESFGLKLGMPLKEIQKFARKEQIGQIIKEDDKFKKYKQITLDSYELVAHWYHIAILYLRDDKNFLYPAEKLSKKLGISKAKVNESLERLVRLEIVAKEESKYKVVSDAFYSNIDNVHVEEAARKFIKELLYKSIDALENVPKTKRVHSTLTMSFTPDKIDNVKIFIDKFKKKFLSTFDEKKKDVEAYSLQVSFIPLSSENDEK